MKRKKLDNPTAYLCPRIINVESQHIYMGGDQAWLTRNSAFKGGCGPVCGANIFSVLADQIPEYQDILQIKVDDRHFISQDEYLSLLHSIYKSMHLREVPVLNRIYDRCSRNNTFFAKIPTNFGTGICHFTKGVIRFGLKNNIPLQYRALSTMFCSYTRGLTFIKLALNNGYPVVLLTTNNQFLYTLFDHPNSSVGNVKKMHKHFVTITDIKENAQSTSPELTISSWGKTGTISYLDLYRSWSSPLAFGSGMVYFTPAKSKKVAKRALVKAHTILVKY